MDIIFKSRDGKISERQREHIEQKLEKLTRYLDQIMTITIETATEQHQGAGEVQRVQVTLLAEHGLILRAEQHATDLYTAVDMVQDVLQRQIRRYKEKHWRRGKLRHRIDTEPLPDTVAALEANGAADVIDEEEPQLKRVKEFTLRPMFSDEAIEQMELLGHTFFVFRDADTERLSIVYRRKDGNYGMIIPR
ncbi:MAG: ribosome-associated translation inhibitor RaiA [Chloroflexaceae bacterium]|nr:ribosome-associated translation inhibitor RaiA [Chloroflexaceae bacterium]NJL33628.1 ribosome-associated translation inhibitor RaiA [Chloroflexaceae bacterium]NJO05582.1 ribosome-associated translation inhibitor RaiA [Chloroflexaceae bacterium]